MAYPHKWSPISCRSSAGQGKHAGQGPTFYRCSTQPTRTVQDNCCRKFVLPQKWTKVYQNRRWPAMYKCPLSCQISSHSAKQCMTNVLQIFYTFQYSGKFVQRDPLGQSSPILAVMYNRAPSINLLNDVPFSKPVYKTSAAKFRRFCWRHDRQKSKRYVSAYHMATINELKVPQLWQTSINEHIYSSFLTLYFSRLTMSKQLKRINSISLFKHKQMT